MVNVQVLNGMKGWQILFLHKHLHDIFPESENLDKGLEKLHLPAMFRYFGMTNLRADKTSITLDKQNKHALLIILNASKLPVVCQLPQSPIIAPWTLVLSSVNNASSVIQEDATVNISAQSSWVFSANLEGDDYD